MIKPPLAALILVALSLPAFGDTPESLSGLQITGWEMMHGGAGQTETLGFHPDGRLTLEIAGDVTEGQWRLDETGHHCVSLPDIGETCFDADLSAPRVSVVLTDAQGQILRMWSGEQSPLP